MDNESESDDVESVFSIEDASSISSVATDELQDPAEEFISFLLSDKIVSHLISIASKETPDAQTRMFVRLRILLKVFGKDLHGEAKNVDEEAAGKLIRAKATYVTTRIKSLRDNLPNQQATLTSVSLVSSNESSQQDCASLRSLPADQGIIDHDDRLLSGRIEEEDVEDEDRNAGEEVAQQDSNVQYISLDVLKQADQDVTSHNDRLLPGQIEEEDVQDDDRYEEEEEDAQQDTTVQQVSLDILKQRVADSKAFEAFRLRFWRLLFPNPFRGVEHMMETVVLPTNEAVHTVTFNVSWDLFAFIDSEFDYIKRSSLDPIDLHKILTIMGTSVKAVTTTAGEYAKWKWCSSDIDMLEYMNALMKSLSDSTARGFPIARRYNQEKGLEIPFHIMTSLAKVMYPLEEPGIGHYLRAFSSLVFPSKVSANCETIQWHMTKPHKGYLKAGSMPPSVDGKPWAHTKTLEELVFAKRNFLGYVRAIEMHIGSGSAIDRKNIGTVFNSGANRENPAIALEWNRIQTGTSGLGLFGVQIEANIIYNQGLFYSIETSWYRGLLDTAMITPIIIYDHAEEAKCAWMVPSISAVLFMAHVWAKVVGDTLGSLPTAALSWNGGEAAYRAILDHSRDVIRDSLEEKEYTFRDLVSRLLICLDKIQHVEARARAEPRRSVSLETSEKLYGWDLVKIAQGNGTAWRQELEVSQNWRVLSRSCVVLFCQNAGELFRPASTTKICHVANPINTTSDCLVAPIKCLRFLSKEHGQRDDSTTLKLDDDLFWTPQGLGLFDDCNMCYKTSARSMKVQCKKTKQSISKEDRTRKSNLRPPEEGAVVFGRNKLQKTNYLVPESSSMSQTASTDTPATSLSIGDLHELAQPAFQTENRNRRWDFIHLFRKKGA
ncbi:uncharacterized protein KY384_004695 [Bacidia gigantensis]|uniref:uncharacterized protein n=1 Tax=Bacidia gigantensis TaxID=2732470 RepID=UPI001D03A348|nr:uncharacterized protein KY384_004695 [Bacidia gigantensis]KAG8530195.1 hypothetical protein KY384_004695 [Bacidia gigantensis]